MNIVFNSLYNLQLIFNCFATLFFLILTMSYRKTIFQFNISRFFKIFLILISGLLVIIGSLGIGYEAKKNIEGHNINQFKVKPNIVRDSLDYLIVVAQGIALSPHEDLVPKGMTDVDASKLRDMTGLGLISDSNFNNRTQVLTYSATHNLVLAPTEILTSILYFKKLNPNGKIILVGHSVGGYDLVKVSEELLNYNTNVDLLITMDNSNIVDYSVDLTIPKNVKRTINYNTVPSGGLTQEIMSGGVVKPSCKSNLYVNITLPKCTHTNIDNTLAIPIIQILQRYINNHENPFTVACGMKKIRVYSNVNLFHTKNGLVKENPTNF